MAFSTIVCFMVKKLSIPAGHPHKQIPTHDSLLDVLELVFALEDKQAMHIAIALMCDDLV